MQACRIHPRAFSWCARCAGRRAAAAWGPGAAITASVAAVVLATGCATPGPDARSSAPKRSPEPIARTPPAAGSSTSTRVESPALERLPQPGRAAPSRVEPRAAGAPDASATLRPGPRGGAFYKDDGPGENPPPGLDRVPDAEPRHEPLHRFANRPYTVFGREYVPATTLRAYRERGLASWYGRKFHGQQTSTGEIYDMYAMTAAHPTLPLPSYVRVTNPASGRSVVVRVNDRGPFHPGRIIDLSYTAALKLGLHARGSGDVEVESIVFGMDELLAPLAEVAEIESAPAQLPVREETGMHYVQLGAFANYANAESFVAHAANQLAAAGVQARVKNSQGLFRVVAGPYEDRTSAAAASERIRAATGLNGNIRAE